MNAFISDLIDHKERVAKYMLIVADVLHDYILPLSVEPELKGTLIEIIVLATDYEKSGVAPFESLQPKGQLIDLCANTMAYFSNKDAYDGGWTRYAILSLFKRAAVHDNSKFSPEEFDLFSQAFPILQKHAYGSDGYKDGLKLLGPALKHHYAVNDHHTDFFSNGIAGMHAVQLIEMCCDWLAASARSQTPIEKSLEINKERFRIDDHLYPIIKNTVIMLMEQ